LNLDPASGHALADPWRQSEALCLTTLELHEVDLGAIIAAALPQTKAEAKVMGQASDSVKQAAGEAVQSGFEAAKDTTMSAADAAAKSVAEADLGGHASRMTQNIADKLKEAADDVVTAAFSPSRNPNT